MRACFFFVYKRKDRCLAASISERNWRSPLSRRYRGVSRKARRHIIKIRMPQSPARAPASESVATEEIITPNREGRPDTRTGLVSSPPEDRMAPTSQQPEPGAASDADAVVAVKVLWLFFSLSDGNHGVSALYSAVEGTILRSTRDVYNLTLLSCSRPPSGTDSSLFPLTSTSFAR